jgi:hypothetical protein
MMDFPLYFSKNFRKFEQRTRTRSSLGSEVMGPGVFCGLRRKLADAGAELGAVQLRSWGVGLPSSFGVLVEIEKEQIRKERTAAL